MAREVYHQDDGMANRHSIAFATFKPKVLLGYVDDTFAIWRNTPDEIDNFTYHLNIILESVHLSVK